MSDQPPNTINTYAKALDENNAKRISFILHNMKTGNITLNYVKRIHDTLIINTTKPKEETKKPKPLSKDNKS